MFYLAMPEITHAADGTQDTFLVRVRTDEGIQGWGESDASPLVSIVSYVFPMSHGLLLNIRESLLGERLDTPEDIRRLHVKLKRNSRDLQQLEHAFSGTDLALWDALGRKLGQPVYALLGYERSYRKTPYASVLFGDTPEETREQARRVRSEGYRAAKFGWGPLGRVDAETDVALVRAAREGLGPDMDLMIDAGNAWGKDVNTAYDRACEFAPFNPTWIEEPLSGDAVEEYGILAKMRPPVKIAAGEDCTTLRSAEDLVLHGGIDYLQVDVARIGGITPGDHLCKLAQAEGLVYVNHTFKSHITVAASVHVFAGVQEYFLVEYPADASALARELTSTYVERDPEGYVAAPSSPGLGVDVDLDCVRRYMKRVRIEVDGEALFDSMGP